MRGNSLALILALFLAAAPYYVLAAGGDTQPALKQDSSSQILDGVSISTDITLRAGPALTPGARAYLQLDIYSTALQSDEIQVALLNGFAAVALPPGLDLDGEARMLYFDPDKDSFEYMYSQDYPRLPRLEGAEAALAQAQSGQPREILDGLRALCQALDPAINFIAPSDPRLTGSDASYTLTGTSWLIPASVLMAELVNPYQPEESLFADTMLRVSIPVKVTGAINDPRVIVYLGALSTGVIEQQLLPEHIPLTALPLAPLPEVAGALQAEPSSTPAEALPPEAPPAEEPQPEPPANPPARDTADPSGTEVLPIRRDRTRSESQDEQPAPVQPPKDQVPPPPGGKLPPSGTPDQVPPAPAGKLPASGQADQPPPPPQPIPTLVFGYDWVSWETELDLSALLGATVAPASEPPVLAEPASGFPAEAEPAGTDAGEPAGAVEISPAEPRPAPPARTEPAPPAQSPGVREVPPGTLPEQEQEYRVPLKEISADPFATPQPQAPSRRPLRDPGSTSPANNASAAPAPPGLGEMVLIPAGPFMMGASPADQAGEDDELPRHEVTLPAYYIDKYPVTNAQFYDYCFSTGYQAEGEWQKYYNKSTANEPVRSVTWNDATAYAKWAGKRLPSEAEWEKAARGTESLVYPWGNEWSEDKLPRDDAALNLANLGASASPYGVIGMVGVVWQWTASAEGSYPFSFNLVGPGFERYILRGGAQGNSRAAVRCANRYAEPPKLALGSFGFRCAKDG